MRSSAPSANLRARRSRMRPIRSCRGASPSPKGGASSEVRGTGETIVKAHGRPDCSAVAAAPRRPRRSGARPGSPSGWRARGHAPDGGHVPRTARGLSGAPRIASVPANPRAGIARFRTRATQRPDRRSEGARRRPCRSESPPCGLASPTPAASAPVGRGDPVPRRRRPARRPLSETTPGASELVRGRSPRPLGAPVHVRCPAAAGRSQRRRPAPGPRAPQAPEADSSAAAQRSARPVR
jgi:hypothetical protein